VGARRLDLAFHRIDGRVEHISLGTARPNRDPRHLAGLLSSKLDTIDPGLGVEDMILAVFAVEPLPAEQIASPLPRGGRVGAAGETGAGLAPLLDRLGARLGLDALSRLEPRESHIPEKASVNVLVSEARDGKGSKPRCLASPSPPPNGLRRAERAGVRWGIPGRWPTPTSPSHRSATGPSLSPLKGGEGFSRGSFNKPPRPVRLFAPPEPVEAYWVLPDDPPFRFVWRRRRHRVLRADGPERIAEEWWTETGPVNRRIGAADAIRDYYRVEDEVGRRFWLFRAGLPGDPPPRWFVQGVFA
jgi:protein ImuB